jgi:hypothetical protein
MIIYLVQSAGDLTGSLGYGKAVLDADHGKILVTFADQAFRNRNSILPADDHPSWEKIFQPPTKDTQNEQE